MLSWGLVLVEKVGWIAKEGRHDKVTGKGKSELIGDGCNGTWLQRLTSR